MDERRLVVRRVDGWTINNEAGVLVARGPNGLGFVAFNEDGSGLYCADVDEVRIVGDSSKQEVVQVASLGVSH